MNSLFEISRSGLKAAQKSLTVTSNNIANANTEGYSRQRADLVSIANMAPGKNTVGMGVKVQQIERIRDGLADRQIFKQSNELNASLEKSRVFSQIESVMITQLGDSLDITVGEFFNTFSELSNTPQDLALRRNVLKSAQTMADQFQTIDQDISFISEQSVETGLDMVNRVNSLLENLDTVNETLNAAFINGTNNNEVKDEQVLLLTELSQLMDTNVSFNEAGLASVSVGGTAILNDNYVATLKVESSAEGNYFNVRTDGNRVMDISSGKLGGIIEMVEQEIPDINSQLDELVETIVTEVNQIHATGYGLIDANQRVFFNSSGLTAGSIEINSLIEENVGHIAASSVAGEAGNNAKSVEISLLRDQLGANNKSIIENTIEVISTPGARLNDLDTKIQVKESVISLLQSQQESVAGVDMDEELSNLIQFQNAYQASARVLSTAQELLDTLIAIV